MSRCARHLFKFKPANFSSISNRTRFSSSLFGKYHLRFQQEQAVSNSSTGITQRKNLLFSRAMATQSTPPQSIHDFTVKDAKGNNVDLSAYKGKVLLIVNVASQCGLTNSNYTELTKLYEKYKDQGLEILAFPCNQFGSQEPGTNEEIQEFACTRFKAEYPIFDKVEVNGPNAAPIYKYMKSVKGGLFGDSIKWNFSKFLVDKEGRVVDRYAPTTSPLSIEKDVKKLLGL
ncbi:probable phospholipid hydroperoxide glutathione peroxidase [Salvia miltiorrhiza]|uniref:probable phospholipid hydroperoxide glutathione peroxidase n=1 Tax=Salvia miltiorrhiza TaxID=226208 RepID=UPI0025AD88D7|nr:probable phospholipid hydroperoxide glutathione peroxidase [Salvia miltiorrhiza]